MDATDFADLESWFDRLVDLDATAASTELAALARTDPQLAARLRRLLSADAALAGAVTEPALPVLRDLRETEWEGRKVGDWRVIERIGGGGMGTVYRATRLDSPSDAVALKLLRTDRADPTLRRRFAIERKVLRRLLHPGIARLIDGGETAEGQPYVAMELVEGLHLLTYADRHRLDLQQRVDLLLKVCSAVTHAHARKVIHRDIKSSNILVAANGRTKLLDFGIAKLMPSPLDTEALQRTATAQRFFSAATAAPEQIDGSEVGPACDVYALGALLYELLCGEPPLALRGLTPGQAELAILQQVPLPPSQRFAASPPAIANARARQRGCADRAELADRLTEAFDRVTAKALHKQPAYRHASVGRFAMDLRAACRGEPVGRTRRERIAAALQSHPRIAAGVALLTAAAAPVAWLLRRMRRGV